MSKIIHILTLSILLHSGLLAQVDSLEYPKEWLKEKSTIGFDELLNNQNADKAVGIFMDAISFAQANGITENLNELKLGYGIGLFGLGNYKKSAALLEVAIPNIKEESLEIKAKAYKVQGMNYVFKDKFSNGYKFQMDALKFYTQLNDSVGLMGIYYDIGANFAGQEQFELGLKNYEKGIEIAKKLGQPKLIIIGNTAIGSAYASVNDFEKALSYSEESIELAREINDDEELGWASINRGYILGLTKKYKDAEFNLERAYSLSIKIKSPLLKGYALEQLAEINIQQNKLVKAKEILDESLEVFKEMGQTYSVKNVVKKYAELNFKLKDYDKYKEFTDQYISIKDSIYSKELVESMSDLKQDFEINQLERENEIALLKKDQELHSAKSKTTAAILVGAALMFILLLTMMYIRNKGEKEKNELLLNKNSEIIRQNETLAASNQDLEKFAYIISHDLKEPLRNINGFTKLLARKLKNAGDQDVLEYSNFIINGTKQMEDLLQGLLEYSKINAVKNDKEIVRSSDIAHKVKNGFRIQCEEKNCEIVIKELPDIIFRKTQLSQIFQNLIANAIKFGPNSGNKIIVSCEDKGQEVQFTVKDHGIGIDPQYQKEIFVVFQRLHDRGTYSGSGIGLATCKKIVDDHGGRIWVESVVGKGCSFHFTVPKNYQSFDDINSAKSEVTTKPELEPVV